MLVIYISMDRFTKIYQNPIRGGIVLQRFPSMWRMKKLVDQSTNQFHKKVKIDKKHLDGNLVERIQADCFRVQSAWKSTYEEHYLDIFA